MIQEFPIIMPGPETARRINQILGLPKDTNVTIDGLNVEYGLETPATATVEIMLTPIQLEQLTDLANDDAIQQGGGSESKPCEPVECPPVEEIDIGERPATPHYDPGRNQFGYLDVPAHLYNAGPAGAQPQEETMYVTHVTKTTTVKVPVRHRFAPGDTFQYRDGWPAGQRRTVKAIEFSFGEAAVYACEGGHTTSVEFADRHADPVKPPRFNVVIEDDRIGLDRATAHDALATFVKAMTRSTRWSVVDIFDAP